MNFKFIIILTIIIIANESTAIRPSMLSLSYGYSSQGAVNPEPSPQPPPPAPVPIPSPFPVVQPLIQPVTIPFCVPTLKLRKHYRYEYDDYDKNDEEDEYYKMKTKRRKPYYTWGLSLCEIEVPKPKRHHKKYHHGYEKKKQYYKHEKKYNKYEKETNYDDKMVYPKHYYEDDDYGKYDNYYRR
jgi:hypothetical protein